MISQMNSEAKRVHWSNDPISQEINAQVKNMPDRPRFVLAVISYDVSQDIRNRAVLEHFSNQRYEEHPIVCFGKQLAITYFGFETKEGDSLADFINRLEAADFEECLFYIDGKPMLQARALDNNAIA